LRGLQFYFVKRAEKTNSQNLLPDTSLKHSYASLEFVRIVSKFFFYLERYLQDRACHHTNIESCAADATTVGGYHNNRLLTLFAP